MKHYTVEQQTTNRAKWVVALRSGKYKQVIGSLHPAKKEFCCLGVACNISGLGRWEKGYDGYDYIINDTPENAVLPDDVQNWLGVYLVGAKLKVQHKERYDSLLEMNDAGVSFDEIANVIEAEFIETRNIFGYKE